MMNIYFGKLYNSVMIKGKINNPSRVPQYYDLAATFNRWDYYRSYSGMFFEDIRPYYIVRYESNIRASANVQTGKRGKLFLGSAISSSVDEYYHNNSFLKADTADQTNFDMYCIFMGYQRKTLNYKQFGNNGSCFSIRVNYIRGREKYFPGTTSIETANYRKYHTWPEIKISYDKYFKTNKYFVPGFYFEGVYSSQQFFSNYTSTMLQCPVFTPFPHSNTLYLENFRANQYIAGGLKAVAKITKNMDWRNEAYIFMPYEKILKDDMQKARFAEPFKYQYYMGSSSLVYHTPVGPISLSLNYYQGEFKELYAFFNFGYILFNKKAREL